MLIHALQVNEFVKIVILSIKSTPSAGLGGRFCAPWVVHMTSAISGFLTLTRFNIFVFTGGFCWIICNIIRVNIQPYKDVDM